MIQNANANDRTVGNTFLLSEVLKKRVIVGTKRVGRLKDFIMIEEGPIPHVTDMIVTRPFGDPTLVIPISLLKSIGPKGIELEALNLDDYEKPVSETALLVADYVLDKKVIDLEGREISVVFDVKLLHVANTKKLYVTDVEFGKRGLYRRMGLKWLANSIAEDFVSWSYVQPLPGNVTGFKGQITLKALAAEIGDMHPVDLADIIEELDADQRTEVFKQLDEEAASDTLEELDPHVQRQLISELEPSTVARLIDQMTAPQAADIIAILPYEDKQSILDKQEESILHYTTENFITQPENATVGHVEDNYAQLAREKDVTMYVYVLNDKQELVGVLDINEILIADNSQALSAVMSESIVSLEPTSTLREAYDAFQRYGFRAIPVVNDEKHLLGIMKYRDIMNLKHRFVA